MDWTALSDMFGGLSQERLANIAAGAASDVVRLLNNASGYSNESNAAVIEELTKHLGYTDDSWLSMGIDELVSLLQTIIIIERGEEAEEAAREAGELPPALLQDKKGQNILSAYAGDAELREEHLDLGLVDDEEASALYAYWQTIDDLKDDIKESTTDFKALALEVGASIRNFDELAKVIKDNKDALTDLDKSSTQYGIALGKVIVAAQAAFGDTLEESFVSEHIPDFIEAFVEGSEEAVDRIREALLADSPLQNLQVTIDDGSQTTIANWLNEIMQDREFQLYGYADLTAVFQAAQEAGIAIDDLQRQIQGLAGLEVEVIQDKETGLITSVKVYDAGKTAVRNIGKGGQSKGGGSSKKEKAWENPYDQLYNLTERNEEAIRKRNILEKEYNAILRDRESAANELTKNSLQQLANLQEQLAYQKQLQAGRLKQINAVNNETWTDSEGNRKSYAAWDVTQYASYNQKTNAIEIDWDAIDKVTDETKGKAIEDYIKRLEELQKEFEQTDEDILDIEAEIDEINRRSKDDFLSLEQRVYDAIVKQHQEVIDAYSSFNDTLNDTNDKIMDGLREQIDLERQIRDNTQTEQDIAEKEARLAYLQRDTSGANATETLKLQKEIDDARQSYSDSLIDQQIDSIEKGNEKAAEQRQIQIQTMQAQLDYWTKIGAFWSTVSDLLVNAIDPETGKLDKNNSALVSLLMSADNFGGLSEFGKMDWYDDLVEAFNKGMEGFGNFKMQQAEEAGEITQGGNTYKYDKEKKAWMLGNEAYSAVYDPVTGQYIFTRNKTEDVKTGTIGEPKEEVKAEKPTSSGPTYTGSTTHKYTVSLGSWTQEIEATDEAAARKKAGMYYDTYGIWYAKQRSNYSLDDFKKQFTKDQFMNYLTIAQKYASGGFADYTGPAWLDGTKSKPEAVLSAKQTELFISLRDMLERFGQSGGFNNSYGNTYVDLDVNADIGSDYDVDSLVSRLKRDILESSSYRNVNMLSRGH